VYLRNGQLVVAHTAKDVAAAPSLDSLYLQPIIRLFQQHDGRITPSKIDAPILMIDSKESGEAVIAALIKMISPVRFAVDRSVNPAAVQVVISGNRGAVSTWASYPSYIFFDGRPTEVYDSATLQRVAFISDNYNNYVSQQDSTSRIAALVTKVHGMGKLLRLWASPDNAATWSRLQQLGVDIINTDTVEECRDHFSSQRK
jgi:alkaline phosphatase